MFCYHIENKTWELLSDPQQESPMPRVGHSAIIYKDEMMLIFGGKNEENEKMNDLWKFDL